MHDQQRRLLTHRKTDSTPPKPSQSPERKEKERIWCIRMYIRVYVCMYMYETVEGSATDSACLRTHRYRQHLPTNTSGYTYIDQLVYTVTVTDENRSHKITGTCICMYTCMYYKWQIERGILWMSIVWMSIVSTNMYVCMYNKNRVLITPNSENSTELPAGTVKNVSQHRYKAYSFPLARITTILTGQPLDHTKTVVSRTTLKVFLLIHTQHGQPFGIKSIYSHIRAFHSVSLRSTASHSYMYHI